MTRHHTLPCLIVALTSVLVAPARSEGTQKVVVGLKTLNGKIHIYVTQITRSEAFRFENSGRYRQNVITRAKRWYAREKIGYSVRTHGRDAWKMVPGLRVVGVRIADSRDRVTIQELLRQDARQYLD